MNISGDNCEVTSYQTWASGPCPSLNWGLFMSHQPSLVRAKEPYWAGILMQPLLD